MDTNYAESVALSGNNAYGVGGFCALHVIDVSNPADPILLGAIDKPRACAIDVAVSDDIVYVAGSRYRLTVYHAIPME
jgi:hypothetical protein